KEALESLDRTLTLKPDYADAYYNKAIIYAQQRQTELAVENLEQAIDLSPRYREEAKTDPDLYAIIKFLRPKAKLQS
ncbi:MAG: tetratricopeptide repeat protein, partial [Planktothrix sp.]